MEILNKKLFEKYRDGPIRIKQMFPYNIGIAEGFPIVQFKDFNLFRIFFPFGNYKEKDDEDDMDTRKCTEFKKLKSKK